MGLKPYYLGDTSALARLTHPAVTPRLAPRATYTATEPGEATVTVRRIEYDVPAELNLGITTWSRVSERSCAFAVGPVSTTGAPTTTGGPEATELVYDVTQLVTRSDTGLGLGSEQEVEWVFQFDCGDGRCDGRLSAAGSPFFSVVYRPATEDFTISLDEERANDDRCPAGTTTGVVTPTAWDELGPVEFGATRRAVLVCNDGDIVTEFEDTGRRR